MQRRIQFLPLLTLCALLGASETLRVPEFHFEPTSPRRISTGTEPITQIASKGKALCEVVIPAESVPMLRFAGNQLAFYLEKITGAKVPVKSKVSGKKQGLRQSNGIYSRSQGR